MGWGCVGFARGGVCGGGAGRCGGGGGGVWVCGGCVWCALPRRPVVVPAVAMELDELEELDVEEQPLPSV